MTKCWYTLELAEQLRARSQQNVVCGILPRGRNRTTLAWCEGCTWRSQRVRGKSQRLPLRQTWQDVGSVIANRYACCSQGRNGHGATNEAIEVLKTLLEWMRQTEAITCNVRTTAQKIITSVGCFGHTGSTSGWCIFLSKQIKHAHIEKRRGPYLFKSKLSRDGEGVGEMFDSSFLITQITNF